MIRIVAPHFVAAVIVGERAAPIIGYMRTWSADRIERYAASKGWLLDRFDGDLDAPRAGVSESRDPRREL